MIILMLCALSFMEWPYGYKYQEAPPKAKVLTVDYAIQMKMYLICEPNVYNSFFIVLHYLVKLFTHLNTQDLLIITQSLLYLNFTRENLLTCQILTSANEAIYSDVSTLTHGPTRYILR